MPHGARGCEVGVSQPLSTPKELRRPLSETSLPLRSSFFSVPIKLLGEPLLKDFPPPERCCRCPPSDILLFRTTPDEAMVVLCLMQLLSPQCAG